MRPLINLGGAAGVLGWLWDALWGPAAVVVGGCCFWGVPCAGGADWGPWAGVHFALPCASVSPCVSQLQAHVWGGFLGCLTHPTPQLAHAIRLLLEYTETPYEDKLYSCGEAPDYDKSQWINEKEKLGLDFPNLPYFIDGTTKLTQSNAILRYIARKHSLCGETEEEILRVDMLENQIMDFRMSLVMVCYNPDFEKLKPGYLEQLPGKLKLFSNFLGDRKWFAGEKLTFVDFLMFDVLDQNRIFEPKCLEPFKNLKDFMERFGALEKVAAYLKSSRFQKMPINNKMAKWGNKKL
ncbi:glutathione S-transferase Mu 1-like [Passer montanus]|uniref:glutathione S-transferase Mu 1-like n=1 Tax=Passer montanus TaxID=9160 RepID=UPI00196185FE|nr:glutathione S-transferase Mu 1-like [Passer montanus]